MTQVLISDSTVVFTQGAHAILPEIHSCPARACSRDITHRAVLDLHREKYVARLNYVEFSKTDSQVQCAYLVNSPDHADIEVGESNFDIRPYDMLTDLYVEARHYVKVKHLIR